jgi:N-acetylmuramate 1-kinase
MAVPVTDPMLPPPGAPAFLADAGWSGATISPLAGDASFRRYFRVRLGDAQAVLMDAPPPEEDATPFLAVAEWLSGRGFGAPAVLARDTGAGLVLLEDLGDRRMRETVDAGLIDERAIYCRAVDLLVDLHEQPAMSGLPLYDRAVYQREAALFTDWFCPAAGLSVDAWSFAEAWSEVLPVVELDPAPPVTVLRDYHAENIMLLPDGDARPRGLGLLDFQDALTGHPAYDLVSLLQDARRDVSPLIEMEMLAHYQSRIPVSPDFDAAYAVLGAQRNTKIIGIFTRLFQRDGKPRYLEFLPRMWGLLERDLAHPALEPVAQWFAAYVPAHVRGTLSITTAA